MRTREFIGEDHSFWSVGDDQIMEMMQEQGHLFREGITVEDLDEVENYLSEYPSITTLTVNDIGKFYFPISIHATLVPYEHHPSLISISRFGNKKELTQIGNNYCVFDNTRMVNSRQPEFLKYVAIFDEQIEYEKFMVFFKLKFTGTSGKDWKIKEVVL